MHWKLLFCPDRLSPDNPSTTTSSPLLFHAFFSSSFFPRSPCLPPPLLQALMFRVQFPLNHPPISHLFFFFSRSAYAACLAGRD